MSVFRDLVNEVSLVHNMSRSRPRMVCTGLPHSLLMLAFIATCTLVAGVSQADPEIVSFHHGGELVWSNAHDSAAYRVEWAPGPTGVWRSTWQPLQFVVSPQPGLVTSAVPMFYRVVQTSTSPPADNTFVAAGGVISNTDIRVASSIQDGISQAVAGGRSVVAVSVGRYEQRVALAPGVHVRGGYSADFTEWDPVLYPTVIAPPSSPGAQVAVVTARDINVSAGLHDCVIEVPAAVDGNALGVLVVDCDESLEIRGNTIQGGVAPDGADGEDERNGPNGMPGTDGLWEVIFDPSTPITRAPGVGGVLSWMSQDLSGGNGGPSTNALYNLPQASGGNGRGPVVATGGTGGSGADWFNQDVLWILIEPTSGVLDGASGTNGTNGADGGAGSGGNGYGSFSPSLSGFIWVSHSGAAGGNGVNGSGGGGGGASGGCVGPLTDQNVVGASGAGGGSGGGAGYGGLPGQAGGAAIGILLAYSVPEPSSSTPIIENNVIYPGTGGNGGAGGAGGSGGTGGEGGVRLSNGTYGAGTAGNGGDGGRAGHGGGGGGGSGGVAYGIMINNLDGDDAAPYKGSNTFLPGTGGTGGSGGSSPGNAGEDGAAGASGDANF